MFLFQRQQVALGFVSPGEPAIIPVLMHDAVAGNDKRHGVAGAGARDRPVGMGLADALGERAVAYRAAVGTLPQRLPDLALEAGAARLDGDVDGSDLPLHEGGDGVAGMAEI